MAKEDKQEKMGRQPGGLSPTPNQVVAYNLIRARELRGWTQERAAEELAPWLGTRWSKASWSAAERSVDGVRVREFTADDIAAFSQAFGLPIGWWFLPPTDDRLPTDNKTRSTYVYLNVGTEVDDDTSALEATEARMAEFVPLVEGTELEFEDVGRMVVRTVVRRALTKQVNSELEALRGSLAQLLGDIDHAVEKANTGQLPNEEGEETTK